MILPIKNYGHPPSFSLRTTTILESYCLWATVSKCDLSITVMGRLLIILTRNPLFGEFYKNRRIESSFSVTVYRVKTSHRTLRSCTIVTDLYDSSTLAILITAQNPQKRPSQRFPFNGPYL